MHHSLNALVRSCRAAAGIVRSIGWKSVNPAILLCAAGCATITEPIGRPFIGAAHDGIPEISALPARSPQGLRGADLAGVTLVPSANTVRFLQYLEACRELKLRDSRDFLALPGSPDSPNVAKSRSLGEQFLFRTISNLRARFGRVGSSDSFSSAMTDHVSDGSIAILDVIPTGVVCEHVTSIIKFKFGEMHEELIFVSPDGEKTCRAGVNVSVEKYGKSLEWAWNEGEFYENYLFWASDQLDSEVAKCIAE